MLEARKNSIRDRTIAKMPRNNRPDAAEVASFCSRRKIASTTLALVVEAAKPSSSVQWSAAGKGRKPLLKEIQLDKMPVDDKHNQ